jgi:hypothetical protein
MIDALCLAVERLGDDDIVDYVVDYARERADEDGLCMDLVNAVADWLNVDAETLIDEFLRAFDWLLFDVEDNAVVVATLSECSAWSEREYKKEANEHDAIVSD